MTKKEFLSRLKNCLSPLSQEERDNAVRYYEEFFEDCESEEEALKQLGSPEEIAKQILSENGVENTVPPLSEPANKTGKVNTGLVIAIIILTFPLWIGFVAALFGITVAGLALAFALIVAFITVGVTCIGVGAFLLFTNISVGLIILGVGLVAISLFVLAILPLCGLIGKGIKKLGELIGKGFNKLFGKGVA